MISRNDFQPIQTQPKLQYLDVHCTNEAKKYRFSSITVWIFLYFDGAKIAI